MNTPVEITDSLAKYHRKYPETEITGFLMMSFASTGAYAPIERTVGQILAKRDIRLLRADAHLFHEDIFWNVITYAHACHFGIALFNGMQSDMFNPNVAFELGYMYALGKPVCLLKDLTAKAVYVDVIGKVFLEFDAQHPETSIEQRLVGWLDDNGFLRKRPLKDHVLAALAELKQQSDYAIVSQVASRISVEFDVAAFMQILRRLSVRGLIDWHGNRLHMNTRIHITRAVLR